MDEKKELHPLLRSSADPKKLALTVKGILVGVVTLASFTGFIPADAVSQASPVINAIVNAVQGVGVALASMWTAYGLGRKLYRKWFK